MNNVMIRVVIVDDHYVVREGLKGILAQYDDIEVVGEANDGVAGTQLVLEKRPDVVLMDLRMPRGDGVHATEQIKAQQPAIQILVLTTYESDNEIERAIVAGATGFLLKDTPRNTLVDAIRTVARGESTLSPRIAAKLLQKMRSQPEPNLLSEREIEVIGLVAQGMNNRAIGRKLYISAATVKTHLVHIFGKLNVQDRTAAVVVALRRGFIQLPD